jgi:hypothetical protein
MERLSTSLGAQDIPGNSNTRETDNATSTRSFATPLGSPVFTRDPRPSPQQLSECEEADVDDAVFEWHQQDDQGIPLPKWYRRLRQPSSVVLESPEGIMSAREGDSSDDNDVASQS